jgi:hypothetical protein
LTAAGKQSTLRNGANHRAAEESQHQKHETRHEGGPVPAKPGKIRTLGSSDLSRKFDTAQGPCCGPTLALGLSGAHPSGGLRSEGIAMLANQFHEAVAAARNTAALDNTARLLWRAHAEGQIADADAEAIAGAVQARRTAFARPPSGIALSQATPASTRRRPARPRSPNRAASIERRRRQAASGAVPACIAASFTLGEVAALTVIARAVQQVGQCVLPIDKIAALAGVARTTAQNAVRAAERLGLVLRIERRRRGDRSDTNILRIVSREWLTWLKHGGGGFRKLSTTNNHYYSTQKTGENPRRSIGKQWRVETHSAIVPKHQGKGGREAP